MVCFQYLVALSAIVMAAASPGEYFFYKDERSRCSCLQSLKLTGQQIHRMELSLLQQHRAAQSIFHLRRTLRSVPLVVNVPALSGFRWSNAVISSLSAWY